MATAPATDIQRPQRRGAPAADEKAALIKGVSEVLLKVLNKPLDSTFVAIEEAPLDNSGWGGLPALEFRRQRQAGAK